MGGQTETRQEQQQQAVSNPWAPAQPALANLLGNIGQYGGNVAPSAAETQAVNRLRTNAAATPDYAPQATGLISDLLAGGPDRTGIVKAGYDTLQSSLTPFARGDTVDPTSNPLVQKALDASRDDVTRDIRSQFAAAGRDFSGSEANAIARGITSAQAPLLLNQYNTAQANQLGAINTLYGAGNTTAGALSGLDQTALANRGNALNLATTALPAVQDLGATRMLGAENAAFGLPLSRIQTVEGLVNPIASLGGQTSGSSTTLQTQQQPLWPTLIGAAAAGAGLAGRAYTTSDARAKEHIAPVGALYSGEPVYSYNYVGDDRPRLGLLAQDIEQATPDAVARRGGTGPLAGLKAVDYGKATEKARVLGMLHELLAG